MTMPDLLPCPFCGGVDLKLLDYYCRAIACLDCGSEGPEASPNTSAAEAWNTRVTAADYHKGYQQGLIDAHEDAVEAIDDHMEDEHGH